MFARQLYKQAAITPSSCREFRALLFVNAVPPRISRAHPELPRRAPGCLTLTMSRAAAAVIIYHILLCILRTTRPAYNLVVQFVRKHRIIRIYLIPRAIALSGRRFYTDSHLIGFIAIQFGSRIIAFPSCYLARKIASENLFSDLIKLIEIDTSEVRRTYKMCITYFELRVTLNFLN